MFVKRFFEPKLAQTSYMIGCVARRECIVIDPNRDADQYVKAAEAEEKTSRNVVPKKYRDKYGKDQNNGDEVAKFLGDFTKNKDGSANKESIHAVAAQNGIDPDRWSTLNIGMQRMNLGNVLRGMIKNGKRVVIGDPKKGGREWAAEAPAKDTGKATKAAKL